MIIAVLFAVLFISGFAMLEYSCGRQRPQPDFWDRATLEKYGFSDIAEAVFKRRDWLLSQDRKELVCVSFDNKLLYGTFVECENAKGTVIHFHGWHSSYKLDFMAPEFFHSLGYNLLICEQRAQERSEGRYMTYGVRESRDVESWVTYLTQLLGEDQPIFLNGISMGAATVLMAADRELDGNVRGIIADCGFTSPYEIIKNELGRRVKFIPKEPVMFLLGIFTKLFAGFGLKERSTLDTVSRSKYPILFIHGEKDMFVPASMSLENYNACTSSKTLLIIPKARHGGSYTVDSASYEAAVKKFTEENLQEKIWQI